MPAGGSVNLNSICEAQMTIHPYASPGAGGKATHRPPPTPTPWLREQPAAQDANPYRQRSGATRQANSSKAGPATFEMAWRSLACSPWLCSGLLALGIASNTVHAHVPLVAFAATGGVMLRRRRAITTVLLIWLANQLIGFGWRGYPVSATALSWGALMGLGTLLVVLLSSERPGFSRSSGRGHAIWQAVVLIAGVALYDGMILLAHPLLADGHAMGWATLLAVVRKQVVWAGAIALGHGWLLHRRQRRLESIVRLSGVH